VERDGPCALVGDRLGEQNKQTTVGPAIGYRAFSFHIARTVHGCSIPPVPGEFLTWATYNFLIFAVVPYLWFRRSYDPAQLNLCSTNWRNDLLVIIVICLVDGAYELAALGTSIVRDTGRM